MILLVLTITPEIAEALGKVWGTSANLWINLANRREAPRSIR